MRQVPDQADLKNKQKNNYSTDMIAYNLKQSVDVYVSYTDK